MSKKIHFIAVGGAVMHNLALALHKKGYQVTGSDDETTHQKAVWQQLVFCPLN